MRPIEISGFSINYRPR